MDATPFDFGDARPLAGGGYAMGIAPLPLTPSPAPAGTWSAIHEAAAAVGAMARINPASVAKEIERGLSVDPQDDGQLAMDQPLQDLADILRRGIFALLTAHTSGGAPQPAARALWREFLTQRDAILDPTVAGTAPGTRF